MSHTVSGQTTSYSWDAAAQLPVVLQDGTNTYVYGLDLISATNSSGVQTYVLHDSLGSTTDLLDGSGNGVATYGYDIFGAIRSQTGSSPNQWLFAGEQRDSDSSLYFLRARYYDPAIGRFVGRDPLGEGNGYSYVFNNPVSHIDPYGLHICDYAPIFQDECKEGADTAEGGLNSAAEVVCGEEGAVGCAKEVFNYLREDFDRSNLGEVGDFLSRFATVDCLTFGIGVAAIPFGPGAWAAATITNSAIHTMADDKSGPFAEAAKLVGPQLGVDYTKAFLRNYKMYGTASGGVTREAATLVGAARLGGVGLATGISAYQCGKSAGF